MRKLYLVTVLLCLVSNAFAQIGTKAVQGNYGGTWQKYIGYNGGVGQVIISSMTALFSNDNFLVTNWTTADGGLDLFIATHTAISTGPALSGINLNQDGYRSGGKLIKPGQSFRIGGKCKQPWYGISGIPTSSTTIDRIILSDEPADKTYHNYPDTRNQ